MKPASFRSTRMHGNRLRRLGLAIALTASASAAGAAGLGRLNLLSGIGQPLRAEIELTSIGREEVGTLSARLASPDAYGQAGIEYGGALASLRFSIQRRPGGQPYVLVTSAQQVNDPFLDILVELNWGAGRLVREYTMLLDPPETRAARAEVDPGQTIVAAQSAVPRRASGPAAAPPSSDAAGSAPTPRRSASSAAASAAADGSGDYVVQSGDTAMSISRANKPESASLEQMLAALYRDNPQAFSGNINRLMAGAKVKMPDAATVQAISGSEAGRIVAQTGNFGRYRERLAQAASEAPASRPVAPQSSGRLTPAVQDNAAPSSETRDQLKLTRPEAGGKSAAVAGAKAPGAASGPTSEEVAAKDRELQETRSRLALLQKNVTDLQELLKLKSQTLADLQKNVPSKAAAAPAPAVVVPPVVVTAAAPVIPPATVVAPPPVTVVAPAPVATSAPAPAPASAPAPTAPPTAVTPTTAPTIVPPAVAPAAPAAVQGPQTAWYEDLLGNTLALIGLGILALVVVAYGLYTVLRRRKLARFEDSIFVDNSVLHANSVFGTTGGQSVDTANSGFHSNFVPVGGGLPEPSEVDPVAEADVYIAYGREAQAEEILKEALRADGTRHAVRLKLLEIYARRGDAKAFETLAAELYAATGGQGNDWAQAAQLGVTIDPHNPLYTQTGTAPAKAVSPAPAPAPAAAPVPAPAPLSFGADIVPAVALASGLGRNATDAAAPPSDLTRTEPMARAAREAAAPSMDLDFDLGVAAQRPAPLGAPASKAAPAPAVAPAPAPAADPTAAFNDAFEESASTSLIEPFSASAFGATDVATRTAVNLPAFRARAEQPSPTDSMPARPASDGFSASDIFGASVVSHDAHHDEPTPSSTVSRSADFRHDLNHNEFAKTEPYDAFSKISLDLDEGAPSKLAPEADTGDKTEVWQAMATKLDLALAYSDIGDKEGARELLDEVVRSGDSHQAERAKELITQLH